MSVLWCLLAYKFQPAPAWSVPFLRWSLPEVVAEGFAGFDRVWPELSLPRNGRRAENVFV